jgi:enamine deaminase RidA (YjgF/YER057c/UK114 family)
MRSAEEQLYNLGLYLPEIPSPVGTFAPFVRHENLLFLSGQGPLGKDGSFATGKVGWDVSTEQAYEHARLAGLVLLACMREALGSLDRVERVVKVLGMVNATLDFAEHPRVINGCSDLFVELFAERGRHARSAIGMGSLPGGITVEIEAIVAVKVA